MMRNEASLSFGCEQLHGEGQLARRRQRGPAGALVDDAVHVKVEGIELGYPVLLNELRNERVALPVSEGAIVSLRARARPIPRLELAYDINRKNCSTQSLVSRVRALAWAQAHLGDS